MKKKFYKKWWFWLIVVLVVLIAAGAAGGKDAQSGTLVNTENQQETSADEDEPKENDTESPENQEAQNIFGVGDTVELNDVNVTLVNVSENSGGNYMTPSDGKVFIVCEFEIENNTDGDITVSSLVSFETYIDDYSSDLNFSAMLSTDKPQLDGTVAAGKKINGVVGYEANPDWSNLEITFTPDFWSGNGVTFAYNK